MTKGCSSYCHPGLILLVWRAGFRFAERLQREILLSMVGSRRTWNTDEPGLGRPKALPSSAPCMASVIWMVLSGRHMPVSVHWLNTQRLEVLHTVTQPHATSGKSPTLPQCRSFYTPLSSKHPPHPPTHPPFPIPVFISPPVPSPHDYVFLL